MLCNFNESTNEKGENGWRCQKCNYFTKFLGKRECRPLLQSKEPNLFQKINHFTWAFARHLYKGMPTVTQEKLDERLKICKNCPLFKNKGLVGGICTHESCGCTIQDEAAFLNKIAWADEKCPLQKWGQIEENGV